ncbi:zinc metalloproteinase nas-13 [Anabrus simplex]|uniref:zinc metalloproteinase nas-13 n=1 Tax=Anabrus simplex TaxID=316456 RepID=UPI0034DD7DF7
MSILLLCLFCVSLSAALPLPGTEEKQNAWELSGRFEGDILLSPDDEKAMRNGLIAKKHHWPNGVVPYVISPVFTKEQADFINATLEEYNKRTCITIRPAVSTDVNLVNVTGNTDGCYSHVGLKGGVQTLNLSPNKPNSGCFRKGTILHEFLHALGFYHMQSAPDRDNYVTVVWGNILTGHEHNFKKYGTDTVTEYGVEYDYNSVMHYSAYAFSKNGNKTIVPLDANAEIGQRVDFSQRDIEKLEIMYGCRKYDFMIFNLSAYAFVK